MGTFLSLDITPISLGPNTPWPNRAEAAVRLLKAQLKIMLSSIKAGTAPATLEKVTHRQPVKAAATVRNQTITYGGVHHRLASIFNGQWPFYHRLASIFNCQWPLYHRASSIANGRFIIASLASSWPMAVLSSPR